MMSGMGKTPDFPKIALRYKALNDFADAARKTFRKGRMTLKTKRDFREGQKIIIAAMLPEFPEPVEIVSEIIQQIKATAQDQPHTYGVRWINFNERKLRRLTGEESPPQTNKEAKPKKATVEADEEYTIRSIP